MKNKITKSTEKNTSWKITQYGDKYGSQLMSYTIEGDKNGLIIVDGGYEDDEKMISDLNDVIQNHNNKVDAWILTHFDTDHAGAYITIREQNKNLNVGALYVPDLPDFETLKKNLARYTEEDWSVYKKYLPLEIKEKKCVHIGDKVDNIIDLKFEVLSTYDDWIGKTSNNVFNDGGIVFKLYGNEQSILFCGDTQAKEIGDYLINNYKDKLKSTYLQISHHGNNNFKEEFYQLVNPEAVFFPSPKWLMFNESNVSWYTAPENWKLLEKMGANIYYFSVSPITVVMR